ncbi:MAG: bacterial Ig-like domain-containing protein, partial [Clostridia bacterium]|nr:bacterial Ig-like domain-containing protein [Clostridia bacterium]
MLKANFRRIALMLAVLTVLVSVFCLTAMAANVSYDFTVYGKTEAAKYDESASEKGGWYVEADPAIAQGLHKLYFTDGIGMEDSSTRYGTLYDKTKIVYMVPAAEQVNIKDFGGILFDRRLTNGNYSALTHGAELGIVLTMDDGQTITTTYKYYDGTTVNMHVLVDITDVEIGKKIAALEGNPKLVSITYIPYVDGGHFNIRKDGLYVPAVKDDPATPDVDETKAAVAGWYYYFLTSHFDLIETAELPAGLEGVKDTFDGTTVTVHDGKITGLDAEKTYKYAPVYSLDADFVEVSGTTEITGLAGGVYEVRGVEADKADSAKVVVVVPKTAKGGLDYDENKWDTKSESANIRDVKTLQSRTPIYNTWTNVIAKPYPSSADFAYLASSYWPQGLNGQYYNGSGLTSPNYTLAPTEASAKYFRENVVAFTYVPSLDEQFDVDTMGIDAPFYYYQQPINDLAKGGTCAIRIYTNGDNENYATVVIPYEVSGVTSAKQQAYAAAGEELDGYVTRIDFINFYTIPADQATRAISAYNMICSVNTYEFVKMDAPTGITIDADANGKGMIKGFNSALTYAYSTDNATWTEVTGVTEVSGLEFTTYYIKQVATRAGDTDSDATAVTINGAVEFVGAPYAEGTAIKGLDADTLYEYSKYDFFGAQGWTDVPAGATEFGNLANALYAVRVKKSDTALASAPKFFLVGNDTAKQETIYTVGSDGKLSLVVSSAAANVKGHWTSTSYGGSIGANYQSSAGNTSVLINAFGKLPTTNEAAFANLKKLDVSYTMADDQIVPISKIADLKIRFNFQGNIGNTSFENIAPAKVPTRVRFHVVGGEQPYYDFSLEGWAVTKSIDGKTLKDATGYVTAIQFFFIDYIPEGATVQDGYQADGKTAWSARDLYPVLFIYNYALKDPAPAPALTVESIENGYKLGGLDDSAKYAYSTDKEEWITLPDGIGSFIVEEAGTYYVKGVLNDNYLEGEDIAEITILAKTPTPEGLKLEGNTIKGLNADTVYEYAVVNALAPKWTEISGVTEITDLEAGVWAVRAAATETTMESVAVCFIIKGANYGSIAFGAPDKTSTDFVLGKWTSGTKNIYNSAYKYGDFSAMRIGVHWAPTYADRMNFYYLYTMANDEVIPVQNLMSNTYYVGFGAKGTCLGTGYVTMKVRVYIAQGTVDYYDCDVVYIPSMWSTIKVDPADFIPEDATGYITAIKYMPVYEMESTSGIITENQYPVLGIVPFMVEGADDLAADAEGKWRVVIEATPAPRGLEIALEDANSYIKGYKITGFDPDKAYEYSLNNGGTYTALPAGATELSAPAGRYYVRYPAGNGEGASASTIIDVPMINPVFGDRNATQYNDWTNTHGSWSTAELHLVSYVYPTAKLNTVYYRYNFRDIDFVKVDEHPFFSIDFNGQLLGMNLPDHVIPNSEMTVELYVKGTSEIYNVKIPWIGHTNTNGYTPNKFTVNLLEEYPELAGKTITGFKIKPFANLADGVTPENYNKGGYLYFRLFYIGFFDSPFNTDSLALNKENNFATVNTLEGLYAEANKILAKGATLTKDDLDVYEVYSDGQKYKVENFEFVAPEDFAAESGSYTVTVNGRLGTTTTADVSVGLASIAIKTAPTKTEYFEGDTIDLEGIELVAILENGDEFAINKGYAATVETVALDMTTVTVTYGGCEATYDITVKEVVVEALAINTWPDKERAGGYMEGDPVDLTGLTIKATYNNGKTEILGLDKIDAVYGAEVMTRGTVMTISYGGKTISGFILTVNGKAISEITITNPAEKTIYMAGEELDITGLELTVNYEDGTSEVITDSNAYIVNADLSEAGEVIVTILYEGFTLEYTVIVRTIDSAFIMTPPT